MNNSASLKSYSISERNSMDNRKSGIIFLFECSASYFLLLECAISWYHEARARVGSAWLFPSAEIHSLPHVMLSVACWSWPIYLISFYGGIFWNTKKVFWYIFHKKCRGSAVNLGEWQGRSCFPYNSVSRDLWLSCFCLHFGFDWKVLLSRSLWGQLLIKCVLAPQSYPTLCNPMDYSPTSLLCPWGSPGKKTGVGCHSLFQGISTTQGSNPGLLHCRQILYQLNHQGSPIISGEYIITQGHLALSLQ